MAPSMLRTIKPLTLQVLLTVACLLWGANSAVAQNWRGLRVTPELRCSPYRAADYSYPQSVELRIIESLGSIWSPYTGRTFTDKRETDIEHIVARSEAHDSGLCAATANTRRRFFTDQLNLTLASPNVNRQQKRDHDAADWLPMLNRCWFADRVVRVRQKYNLSIDRREADALERVLDSCASTVLVRGGDRVEAASSVAGVPPSLPAEVAQCTTTATGGSPARKLARTALPPCVVTIQPIPTCETVMATASCVTPAAEVQADRVPRHVSPHDPAARLCCNSTMTMVTAESRARRRGGMALHPYGVAIQRIAI